MEDQPFFECKEQKEKEEFHADLCPIWLEDDAIIKIKCWTSPTRIVADGFKDFGNLQLRVRIFY